MSVCGWREGRRDIVAEPKCLCVGGGRGGGIYWLSPGTINVCVWVEVGVTAEVSLEEWMHTL